MADDEPNLDQDQLKEMLGKLEQAGKGMDAQRAGEGGGPVASGGLLPTLPHAPEAGTLPVSPVLLTLAPAKRPDPMPICGACPKSMWLDGSLGLKCFCRVMHHMTWESGDPKPVMACDGILEEEA